MTAPEFSRTIRVDTLGASPRTLTIEAEPEERAALARRFGLQSLDRLEAEVSVHRAGAEPVAEGRVRAELVQSCAVSDAPVPARIEEAFAVRFRTDTPAAAGEEEIELGEADLDVIFYDGALIDVGEAVAETLALAIDPYPRAPGAEEALKDAGVLGEGEAGPFGALAGLKDKLGK
jgi:uncharacterized metal-binding protein YceD (DUF177 family)